MSPFIPVSPFYKQFHFRLYFRLCQTIDPEIEKSCSILIVRKSYLHKFKNNSRCLKSLLLQPDCVAVTIIGLTSLSLNKQVCGRAGYGISFFYLLCRIGYIYYSVVVLIIGDLTAIHRSRTNDNNY